MRTLGKYEILDELGSGSMGTVYRAHDSVIDREIALKTIRTGIETEPEMRERFYREARSCGRLQHPNIVTIYDLGEESKTAFIAMELLQGLDFRKLIDQRRDLPLTSKLEWMAQVCDALGHAHRHGVIHRDVKPSNLFLMDTGSVKVLDFGIARLTSSRLTVAGKILGTPNYMAPEQILANPCDGRADLFSAGVVFFELLVCEHPFKAANPNMIPNRIVESEPDSLFDYQSDLPPILEKVFARALAKSPDDRYFNAAAFADDLRAVLEGLRSKRALSLSSFDLPSDQMENTAELLLPQGGAVEPIPAPEGEDSAEWRNSEVLMLIPLFEKAVDQRDQAGAKKSYEALLRVAATDTRYAEAIASCRVRLEQLGSRAGRATASAAPGTQKICAECGEGNRGAARFCIGCGASLDEVLPVKPDELNVVDKERKSADDPVGRPFDTFFDRTAIYPGQEASSPLAMPKQDRILRKVPGLAEATKVYAVLALWLRKNRRYAIPGTVALLAVVIVIAGLFWPGPTIRPRPFVATAKVISPKTEVYESEGMISKYLYTLRRDDQVNILKLPDSASQDWISVQYVVNEKAKAPGFSHRRDLGLFTGTDPHWELEIIFLRYPQPSDEGISVLRDFAGRHPSTPEANVAIAKAEEWNVILHPPLLVTLIPCDTACGLLKAEKLWKEGDYDGAAKDATTIVNGDPENLQAKQLLEKILHAQRESQLRYARQLFDHHEYERAEKIALSVLRKEPNNEEAKQLLQDIELWNSIK